MGVLNSQHLDNTRAVLATGYSVIMLSESVPEGSGLMDYLFRRFEKLVLWRRWRQVDQEAKAQLLSLRKNGALLQIAGTVSDHDQY